MTRSDAGTENGLLATCQMFLPRNCSNNLAGNKSHVYGSSMGNQVMVNQILHSCAIYICNLMNSVARSVIGMFNFTYIIYRLFTLRSFNFDREKKLIGIISANITAVTGRASLRYHKVNVTLLPSYESTGRAQT